MLKKREYNQLSEMILKLKYSLTKSAKKNRTRFKKISEYRQYLY